MNKKIIGTFATLCALILTTSPAHALLDMKALYGSYTGTSGTKSGYGVEMSLPILPVGIGAMVVEDSVAINFTISGTSFTAGTYKGYLAPAYVYFNFGIPFVPVSLKARGGYSLFMPTSGPVSNVSSFVLPGGVYYDVVAIYSMPLLPFIGAYAEVGYANLILNVAEGLKTLGASDAQLSGASIQNRNYAGMTWKAGISIGI